MKKTQQERCISHVGNLQTLEEKVRQTIFCQRDILFNNKTFLIGQTLQRNRPPQKSNMFPFTKVLIQTTQIVSRNTVDLVNVRVNEICNI